MVGVQILRLKVHNVFAVVKSFVASHLDVIDDYAALVRGSQIKGNGLHCCGPVLQLLKHHLAEDL